MRSDFENQAVTGWDWIVSRCGGGGGGGGADGGAPAAGGGGGISSMEEENVAVESLGEAILTT